MEIIAVIWALLWQHATHPTAQLRITSDNLPTVLIAPAEALPQANGEEAAFLQYMWDLAASRACLTISPEHGHSGGPWNLLADFLAEAAAGALKV